MCDIPRGLEQMEAQSGWARYRATGDRMNVCTGEYLRRFVELMECGAPVTNDDEIALAHLASIC